MSIETLLTRLEGVKIQPDGQWRASCPTGAHPRGDRSAGLYIKQAEDGKILLNCMAGCETSQIIEALDLSIKDLFPDQPQQRKPGSSITKQYDYQGADGELIFQVCRMEPKGFRQRRPNGGGWKWSVKDIKPVPYRLPALMASDGPVFICEGEKDADQLADQWNLTATTNAGGAGKWRNDLTPYFTGRKVVILPDNDNAGRDHAEKVAAALSGVAQEIRVVALPGLREKGDVSDWIEAGGTRDQLWELCHDAPPWNAPAEAKQAAPVVPLDLFDALALPPFPVDLLPATVARFAKDQAELIGVDPAVIAMAAIGAAAACIDDRIQIQPKRYDPTWTESARLWIGIVGDPSAKKSPGISKAMGPLFAIDKRWRSESTKAVEQWQEQADAAKKSETPPPARPIERRLIVNDATVEKIGDILSKSEPRGILSYQDELSGWLASMDAYKNGGGKDRGAWLESYNGGPKSIDRIGRGSTFVENWSACVLGGIQPTVIQSYAHNTNHDGMIQRFVLVFANDAGMGVDRAPDMPGIEAYKRLMEHLAETDAAGHPVVKLSEEAHQSREQLDKRLIKAVTNMPNRFLTAALGKWNGLYARLLLTFHCIECAEQHQFPASKPVSGDTARRVASLMWQTLLPHAVRFYQGLDPGEDRARDIASLILARGWERFTVRRDLSRNSLAFRKLKPWEQDETLKRLDAMGWIGPEPGKINERGKPSAYLVNPAVHQRFKDRAERERERRAEVRAIIEALKP